MQKIKICLTGGIASGKTYVSDQLALLGAHVIDADVLAREVVKKNSVGLAEIVDHFGPEVLNSDGTLNRKGLKKIVFSDEKELALLNQITHPLINEAFKTHSSLNKTKLEFWVIPLLNEKSEYKDFNRILAIDVREDIQRQRVVRRDQVELAIAQSIIDSQPDKDDRLKLATDVITNNKSFKELDDSIREILHFYTKLKNTESATINPCSHTSHQL